MDQITRHPPDHNKCDKIDDTDTTSRRGKVRP